MNEHPKKNQNSRPILVTGSHRSGSTWCGQLLAQDPNVFYIHEPFNPALRLTPHPRPFENFYQYLDVADGGPHESAFRSIIQGRYPLLGNLSRERSIRWCLRHLRECFRRHRDSRNCSRALIKDPIAFFSAEWLVDTFDMDALVLIRHPAAFCSSLKLKQWRFDFNVFLRQPKLMERHLSLFEEQITVCSKGTPDLIDQGILLWNCIHAVVLDYRNRRDDWFFRRHEDLSLNPVSEFRTLYRELNLNYSPRVEAEILRSSGSQNPSEQQEGQEFVRNSVKNIVNWKQRLSSDEIARIRIGTEGFACQFYSDSEW